MNPSPDKPQRLLSLDAFRGITIAGMILVNNPGSWGNIYSPLRHADWDGLTPTDLVFPFFLFIVGTAISFAFARRIAEGADRLTLIGQVARRSLILVLLGLSMFGFPDWRLIAPFITMIVGLAVWGGRVPPTPAPITTEPGPTLRLRTALCWVLVLAGATWFALNFAYFENSKLRVPGVLQRIGLCYFAASLVVLLCGTWLRVLCLALLLGGYWALVAFVSAPDGYLAAASEGLKARPSGVLHDWIDVTLLSGRHLYRERPDPEGLLSTIPAMATVLCGVLAGEWLRSKREGAERAAGLFFFGGIALVLGLWVGTVFPLNKKIWSSSYVLATAGLAMQGLAACYWLIDVKGLRGWSWPFVLFGSNAIALFVGSSLTAKMLSRWKFPLPEGGEISASAYVYKNFLASWAGPVNGSLLYALVYVGLWLIVAWAMYRAKVFIKV